MSLKKLSKKSKKNRSIPVLPLELCYGKTYKNELGEIVLGMTTYEHCRIVGHIAKIFRRKLPRYLRKKIPRSIGILAALHDIGKISPEFVLKIYAAAGKKTGTTLDLMDRSIFKLSHHNAVSQASFNAQFSFKKFFNVYGGMLGSHHGRKVLSHECFQDNSDLYGGVGWANLRKELTQKLIKEFGDPEIKKLHDYDAELISGFISLCDWIGSDDKFFPACGKIKNIHAKALEAIEKLGWVKSVIKKGLKFSDIFEDEHGNKFKAYESQKKFIETVTKPGVYIFEDATGKGKTEPALMAAYNLLSAGIHDGIYYALPTRITSERIYKRFLRFIKNSYEKGMAPRLIHGQSLISDINIGDKELASGGMWFTSNRRALMLPFGIGTIDQILMCVLHTKYNFVRTFGLANKVIIIDEYHSYDAYTGKLTDLLIKKLRKLNCTVIILSATLTSARKRELLRCKKIPSNKQYPLITVQRDKTYTKSAGECADRKIKVRKIKINYKKIYKTIEKLVKSGHQVLWIINTVDRAVFHFQIMRKLLSNYSVGLIHSRIPAIDRIPLEEKWIERLGNGKEQDRSQGSLLIGTQVLEQSIDADSDFLITDLAPSDFLIQRMGRLFRHKRSDRPCSMPETWILCPELSKIKSYKEFRDALGINAKIYDPYVLWRSYRTWSRYGIISDPSDLREILEKTYRDALPQDPVWVQDAFNKLIEKKKHLKELAESCTGSHVTNDEEEDFLPVDALEDYTPTRHLSVPTRQILLIKSMKENKIKIELNFLDGNSIELIKGKRSIPISKEIVSRMVKVPCNKTLETAERPPDWLKILAYGKPIPVIVDSTGKVLLGNTETGYYYEKECGVYKPIQNP